MNPFVDKNKMCTFTHKSNSSGEKSGIFVFIEKIKDVGASLQDQSFCWMLSRKLSINSMAVASKRLFGVGCTLARAKKEKQSVSGLSPLTAKLIHKQAAKYVPSYHRS